MPLVQRFETECDIPEPYDLFDAFIAKVERILAGAPKAKENSCQYLPEQVCFRPDDLIACGAATVLYCDKCECDVCETHSVLENGRRVCRDCRGAE